MTKKRIMLSHEDYTKLKGLLKSLKTNQRLKGPHLIQLYEELASAVVIDSSQIPAKRVVLYAKVEYTNLQDNSRHAAEIVFPADANSDVHKYSILTPLGTALIGEKEQDITICHAPVGEIPLRIDKIVHQTAALK